jgi:hypothetical protein
MATGNNGLLDGIKQIPARLRALDILGGVPGAPLGYRLRGATLSGPPVTGTWRSGDTVPDRAGVWWTCTKSGTPGTWKAAGSGQHPYDTLIAPSNSPAAILASADVVLTGTADQTAINAALAALPGAGRVLIGPGTVSLTDKIIINQSNTELHGCGYATYIQAAAGFNASAAALVHVGPASVLTGNVISDMQLDGNHGTASGSAVGILASTSQLLVERVEVKNSNGDSYYFQAFDGSTPLFEILMSDCYAWFPAGFGVHVGTTVDNSEFIRVFAVGSNQGTPVAGSSDGFNVAGSGCKFLLCHPYFNAGNGMTLASGSANVSVIGGEYETNTGYGIQALGSDHLSVAEASFYANSAGSLDLRTGTNLHATVTASIFHDIGPVATGVLTADASTFGLSLTGNTFDCATGSALTSVISIASSGGAMTGNIFRTNNSAVNAILLNGATFNTVTANFLDEKVTESGGADFNTIAHNRWNNTATTPVTLVGANSRATDNLPAPDQGAISGLTTVMGSAVTGTSGTASQNVTGLVSPTLTTRKYSLQIDLTYLPTGTIGSTTTFGFSAGSGLTLSSLSLTSFIESGATTAEAATSANVTSTTLSDAMWTSPTHGASTGFCKVSIWGTVTVSAGGTLQVVFANTTSADTCNIVAGAAMTLIPI